MLNTSQELDEAKKDITTVTSQLSTLLEKIQKIYGYENPELNKRPAGTKRITEMIYRKGWSGRNSIALPKPMTSIQQKPQKKVR